MTNHTKTVVLACVTSQYNCDRIIETAKHIADENDSELKVLSVLKPTTDYSKVSDKIEYLYLVSKEFGADMTVLFDTNPPKAVSEFVKNNKVNRIVTGMHDGGEKSFLVSFNENSPFTSITMVAKNNMIYSMDICNSYLTR